MAKLARHQQVRNLEKSGHCRIYHLRNINDGCLLEIMDEGPLETNPNFRGLDPTGTRQQLIRMLRKVDSNDGMPIFWSDRTGQPDVYDHLSRQYIKVPVMNQEALTKLKGNLARRADAASSAKRMLSAAKHDADEVFKDAAAKTVGAPVGEVADVIAAANAAALPGGAT